MRLAPFFLASMILLAPSIEASPKKCLKKPGKNLDQDDPVHVALYSVLKSWEDNFESVLGASLSTEDQQVMIDRLMSGPDLLGQGKMGMLAQVEDLAMSARYAKPQIPGASNGYYTKTEMVQSGGKVNSKMQTVSWSFDVGLEDSKAFAHELRGKVDSLLKKDKKWMRNDQEDPSITPHSAFLTSICGSSGLGGSDSLAVWITYPRNQEIYDWNGGVQLQVHRTEVDF